MASAVFDEPDLYSIQIVCKKANRDRVVHWADDIYGRPAKRNDADAIIWTSFNEFLGDRTAIRIGRVLASWPPIC